MSDEKYDKGFEHGVTLACKGVEALLKGHNPKGMQNEPWASLRAKIMKCSALESVLMKIVNKLYWDGEDVRLDPLSNGPKITRSELEGIRTLVYGNCGIDVDVSDL